ncbi:RNA polymerase sigma factor [Conexibacter sp. DBS9H8]|uniref:RNA polymerase sigma factor n=1 Tax=Conexibacter sp. DBS9H8 TaxID=2937801 RepID=UPI00200F3546|nr:sigma factor [Conexibacter sp. DBS9H8]
MRPTSADWPAFEALYRGSRDDVDAYVLSLLREAAAAEDVTALACERAHRMWASFDRRRAVERACRFGIARNALLDELRRRRRTASRLDEPGAPDPDLSDGEEEILLTRTAVRAALAALLRKRARADRVGVPRRAHQRGDRPGGG